jgi:hypothetical protein
MLLRAAWIASLLSLANIAPLHADPVLDDLKNRYQQECDELAANSSYGDADTETKIAGFSRSVYELRLTSAGKTGTVVYKNFACGDLGVWCGSGGCQFDIIVDGQTFQGFGGRPFSITGHDRTFVLIPKRYWICETSDPEPANSTHPCYAAAVWNEQLKTFVSRDNPVTLKQWNPD